MRTGKHGGLFGFVLLALVGVLVACPSPSPTPPSPATGFRLQPIETSFELPAGGEVTSFVNLNRDAGFSDTVQMTFDNLPAGFSQEWTRDSVNGDCSIKLSVAASVAPGTYTLNLVGKTGAGVSLRGLATSTPTPITVNVLGSGTGSSPNSFTMTTQPSILEIAQGGTGKFRVDIRRFATFNSTVQLSLEGAPSGMGVNFALNPLPTCPSCSFPNSGGTDAQLIVSSSVPVGVYNLKVRGIGGGKNVSANLKVTVRPASDLKFDLIVNPTSVSAVQGGQSFPSLAIQVNKLFGFTADVAITFQNLPTGVTVTPTRNFAVASTVPVGTYSVTVKGTGGGVVRTVPVTLEVVSSADTTDPTSVGTIALDGSFGTNGLVFLSGPLTLTDAVRQPDGKFLVAGIGQFNNGGNLARINPDGTLDGGFGVGGAASGLDFNIRSVVVLSSGKILVSGEQQVDDPNGGTFFFGKIARLNPNGTLDSTAGFGQGGIVTINNVLVFAAFPAAGDKTLALIKSGATTEIIRLTPNGNFDPDFDNGDGRITLPIGNANQQAILDNAGTKIISAGVKTGSGAQYELARFDLNGALDNTFDGDGKAVLPLLTPGLVAAPRISLDASGRILLAYTDLLPASTRGSFNVARFGTNGVLDSSFDGDGKRIDDLGIASNASNAVAVNGKVFAVGSVAPASDNVNYATVRYNDNGSPDGSFGSSGKSIFGFIAPPVIAGLGPQPRNERFNIAIPLPDGKVVVFGQRNGAQNLVMARFNP